MDVLESYFSAPFVPRRAEGTILIGGASVGEEIPFLNQLSSGFRQVVMVEPSPGAASELDTALSKTSLSKKGKIINAALGSQAGTVALVGQGVSARTMSGTPDSGELVPAVTIDSLALSHPDISLITLDVEGDELVALEGGRKTIVSCSPILAVSVYHKPEDLFEIWEFLKKTKVRYRYHLRALDFGLCDLTLFAIPVPEQHSFRLTTTPEEKRNGSPGQTIRRSRGR